MRTFEPMQLTDYGFSEKESAMVPGVKTSESQGYKIYWGSSRGWVVPKGTPKEIVDILSSAVKKGMESEGIADRVKELGVTMQYMTPSEYAKYWGDVRVMTMPILEQGGIKVRSKQASFSPGETGFRLTRRDTALCQVL